MNARTHGTAVLMVAASILLCGCSRNECSIDRVFVKYAGLNLGTGSIDIYRRGEATIVEWTNPGWGLHDKVRGAHIRVAIEENSAAWFWDEMSQDCPVQMKSHFNRDLHAPGRYNAEFYSQGTKVNDLEIEDERYEFEPHKDRLSRSYDKLFWRIQAMGDQAWNEALATEQIVEDENSQWIVVDK